MDLFCELVAVEVGKGASPSSVKKYMIGMYKVILQQLKINRKVHIPNFGTFKVEQREARTMKVGDPVNGGIKYINVKPKFKVIFIPSGILDSNINKNNFKMKEKPKPIKNPKTSIEEALANMLNLAFERGEE